jgi:hypothetical protein
MMRSVMIAVMTSDERMNMRLDIGRKIKILLIIGGFLFLQIRYRRYRTMIDKYISHQEVSHLIIEYLVRLWEHDRHLVDQISSVGDLGLIGHLDRIILSDMILDQSHPHADICYGSILAKWDTIAVVVESAMRYILHGLGIDRPIGNKYYLSSEIGDLGIVQCDLLDDTLVYDSRLDMKTDDLPYLKCSR